MQEIDGTRSFVSFSGGARYFIAMTTKTAQSAIKALETYAKQHDLRITPPRIFALEVIAASPKPLTAYEVLEALGGKLDNPKPPTAYRALEFLSQHGFIHRIESLNAYVACGENHHHLGSQFMICDACGRVEEVHLCHIPKGLETQAADKGFALSHWNAELHGRCRDCA